MRAERVLKNKPDEMLEISPKGTIPVMQFADKVLDESLDIISWAMESPISNVCIPVLRNYYLKNLLGYLIQNLAYHLDRYKYSSRYGVDPKNHQDECKIILDDLEDKINSKPWIFGKS